MDNTLESSLWNLLFGNLLAQCPFDTGNMKSNIVMYEYDNCYEIEINAPKENKENKEEYAKDVNYALKAKRDGRPMSPKEHHNYMWVERTMKQTCESIGGTVIYEL